MILLSAESSMMIVMDFFFQAEDGIRDLVRSRGLGDVYKRQAPFSARAMKRSAPAQSKRSN